jgi:two-component system NtrC family response regulator
MDAAAIEKLRSYDFPGNIRELRNLLERACILAAGETISEDDLRLSSGVPDDGKHKWIAQLPETIVLAEQLESIERDLLQKALRASDGVQAEAARRLGISRSDIAYKIKKYGL